VTFALRELGSHLAKIRKLANFSRKGKKAIELIARTLQNDEKRITLTANQVDALRVNAVKTDANVKNLHERSKTVNSLLKKHKKAIRSVAAELVGTKATQKALAIVSKQSAEQGAKDRAQLKANQANVKALHTAAQKFQVGIVSLHNRELATRTLAAKQKKALKAAMKIVAAEKKQIAALKQNQQKLKATQAKLKKHVTKKAAAKPVAHKPAARKPVAHKPVAHKPVAHKPVAHKPVAHKPVAHKPAHKKPAAAAAKPKPVLFSKKPAHKGKGKGRKF